MLKYNFCIVSPHGVGLQSFLYYLSKLNLWGSQWYNQISHLQQLNAIHKLTGITIDNIYKCKEFKNQLTRKVPVFWLVRDPIEIITSVVNMGIGHNIVISMDKSTTAQPLATPQERIVQAVTDQRVTNLEFSAQFRLLQNYGVVKIFDVKDLLPDRVVGTMTEVANTFRLPMNIPDEILKISYNHFSNRIFRHYADIQLHTDLPTSQLFPEKVYDFFTYKTFNHRFVQTVGHNNKSYAIVTSVPHNEVEETQNKLKRKINLEALANTIQIREEICLKLTELYNERKISSEDTLNFLLENQQLRTILLNKLNKGLVLVGDHKKNYAENWKYYNKFVDNSS